MSNSRYPLRINVGFFINQPAGASRVFHFDFDQIRLTPDFDLQPLHGEVQISRTPQGLFLEGRFTGKLPSECVRCLAEYKQELKTTFQEVFAFRSRTFTDSGLIVPEDGNIDLSPLVREYLLLEMPIKPLCRPDCLGLCIECGENLNERLCEHALRVKTE